MVCLRSFTNNSNNSSDARPIRLASSCRVLVALGLVIMSPCTLQHVSAQDAATGVIENAKQKAENAPTTTEPEESRQWRSLFNGKDLDGWKVTNFGGEGEVFVEEGQVVITQGAELSGIHTEQDIPKINYEIEYEAQREAGSDFFAGITFPVGKSHCSLILGGWGGGVCGLSSLDGMDAVENDTTSYREFEKGKWYKVRLVVTDKRIDAWIDKDHIVDVETEGRRISVRFEVERSKPLGFSTWQTTGRIRNARIRELSPKPLD